MIIKKSTHPVLVKKIKLNIWSFRSELEEAINLRKQDAQITGEDLVLNDVEFFYQIKKLIHSAPDVADFSKKSTANPENSNSEAENNENNVLAFNGNAESHENPNTENDPFTDMAISPSESPTSDENTIETADENETKNNETTEIPNNKAEPHPVSNNLENTENKITAIKSVPYESSIPVFPLPRNGDEILEFYLSFKRPKPNPEKISYSFSFLSEIDMEQARIFSVKPFMLGSMIVIHFDIPKSFILLAEVKHCIEIGQRTRIISEIRPKYRLIINFLFRLPGERTQLRQFLKSVEPDIPMPVKKAKEKPEAELDDLDF